MNCLIDAGRHPRLVLSFFSVATSYRICICPGATAKVQEAFKYVRVRDAHIHHGGARQKTTSPQKQLTRGCLRVCAYNY